jgi:hypothetical protein
MKFIFSSPLLIRHLWLLETLVFLHCSIVFKFLIDFQMREDGHLQALVNKAQHIVHIETLLKFCCCLAPSCRKKYEIEKCITVCPHSICRWEKTNRIKCTMEQIINDYRGTIETLFNFYT